MKIRLIAILLMCTSVYSLSQITNIYDNLSRLIQVTNTNGTIVKYSYDELGKRSTKVITTASYGVTASASPVSGGTVAGSGSFPSGQSCTLIATPNSGYAFSNWTEGGSVVSTNASYSFTVSAARTLVANFVQSANYTINLSASPTAGGTTSGGGTYASGASRTVTATPNTGYTFTNWTENGTMVSTSASYTFTLSANRTLVANFAQNTYAITANAIPTVGGTVTGAVSYNYGASCTLTASPKTGYVFSNWTENGIEISTNSTLSFTVTSARNVTANFAATVYSLSLSNNTLSINAASNSSGTINITSNTAWSVSSNQTWLTVSPVSGSNNGTLTLTAITANSTATARTATVTVSGTGVTAQTIMVTQTETGIVNYNVSITSNPYEGGTTTGSGSSPLGSSKTVSATANTGYTFTNWTENGTVASTNASYTFTLLANRNLVANFTVNKYEIKTSIFPVNAGTTNGAGNYTFGALINLTATANAGYEFLNWTENNIQVSKPALYNFTVYGNRTLVANFISSTSILELQSYGIKVFSNANKAIIEGASGWEVRIVDISGRTVMIKNSNSDKYEIYIPVPGLYLVRLSNKEKVCSEKVIIK